MRIYSKFNYSDGKYFFISIGDSYWSYLSDARMKYYFGDANSGGDISEFEFLTNYGESQGWFSESFVCEYLGFTKKNSF